MNSSITRLTPDTLPDSRKAGYSQISIVEPGRMAYISGQVAWEGEGREVPSDLGEQARIAGRNARAALGAVGAGPEHIVIAHVYVTDLTSERLAILMPVLHEIFAGAEPSLTGIGVAALAGPGLQVELELTVRLPD